MNLANNLLYLLLLYAVLEDGKLNMTTAILIALGIMLFGFCRTNAMHCCCNNRPNQVNGFNFAANPFATANNLF